MLFHASHMFIDFECFRDFFRDKWTEYLKERNILEGQNDPVFPDKYGVKERDAFYDTLSLKHWGGSCGHDAPMIA